MKSNFVTLWVNEWWGHSIGKRIMSSFWYGGVYGKVGTLILYSVNDNRSLIEAL